MYPNGIHRRTAVKTLLSLGVGVLVAPSFVAARSEDAPSRCEGVSRRGEPTNGEALANRPETYLAVVDRIVAEQFVVLLLEVEGEIVDQLVVPHKKLPAVEEGNILLLTLEDDELSEARPLVGESERRRRWSADRIECLSS